MNFEFRSCVHQVSLYEPEYYRRPVNCNILNKYSPSDFRLHASDIHRNWYEHISNNRFSVTVKLPHIAILSAHCCSFHLLSFIASSVNRLSANFTKWSNTLKQFVGYLLTNCLSVFGHFVGFALTGLKKTQFG